MKLVLSALLIVGTLFAQTSATVAAQPAESGVRGIVKDQSGAAIPKANVTLTDRERNFTFASRTDETGRFFLTAVPAGQYALTVGAPGFRTYSDRALALAPGQQASIDIAMQAGAATFELRPAPGKWTKEEVSAKLREATMNAAPNRPCAVPLSSVQPQGAPAPMKTIPLPDPDRLATKDAPLPAPSCDDVKR